MNFAFTSDWWVFVRGGWEGERERKIVCKEGEVEVNQDTEVLWIDGCGSMANWYPSMCVDGEENVRDVIRPRYVCLFYIPPQAFCLEKNWLCSNISFRYNLGDSVVLISPQTQ